MSLDVSREILVEHTRIFLLIRLSFIFTHNLYKLLSS